MELQATTVVWQVTARSSCTTRRKACSNPSLRIGGVRAVEDDVSVVSPFVGGAFGVGLRPQHQLFMAVMAALELQRSVRVVLTRDEGFSMVYRPATIQRVALGADEEGRLTAVMHDAIAGTSTFEEHQENVVNWSGLLYKCDNVLLTYKLSRLDTARRRHARAGGSMGVALESAMDSSLARRTSVGRLRLRNYAGAIRTTTGDHQQGARKCAPKGRSSPGARVLEYRQGAGRHPGRTR